MTAQLSPMRAGRITGSRVAAIIGVSKYQSRDDVMREMVRQALGADPEFTGNIATEYGQEHEDDARADYERAAGQLVLDAQEFITHPEFDWLGVSPDGLVADDGMVEIKCPSGARYTTAAECPHYEAQIQLQLACTGRAWCDFVIWRSFDQADRLGVEPLIIDRVPADPDWLPTHLVTLSEFYAEFQAIIADPAAAEPFLTDAERDDPEWADAAAEFLAADQAVEDAGKRLDAAKARLRELAGDRSARGCGVTVTRANRSGTVDWKKIAEKHAPGVDTGEFRKPGSVVVTVKAAS